MSFENIINNIYIFFARHQYSFNRKTIFTILLSIPIKSSQFKLVRLRSIFHSFFFFLIVSEPITYAYPIF